jgi:ketosteroid isomerase-like protein
MSDQDDVKAAVDQWLVSLDSGNLQGMLDTCDPEVVTANERMPTTVGIQAVAEKYEPRIAAATFQSGFEIERTAVYGDFAMVIGIFSVKTTNKQTGETGGGSGRLALGYRRHGDGSWKLILDMDNNA